MFFLMTYILIGKYYPKITTQFVIGCVCYILSFFIINDMIESETSDKYKGHIISLIAIDAGFLLYRYKYEKKTPVVISDINNINDINHDSIQNNVPIVIKPRNDNKTTSIRDTTLSSEINDFRITHDSIFSETNELFSTSDFANDSELNDNDKLDDKNKLNLVQSNESVNNNSINESINNESINNELINNKSINESELAIGSTNSISFSAITI